MIRHSAVSTKQKLRTRVHNASAVAAELGIDRYLVATTLVPLPSTTNDSLWVRLDANKDGWLSADEAKVDSSVLSNWRKMDGNNDGRIARVEFNAAHRQ